MSKTWRQMVLASAFALGLAVGGGSVAQASTPDREQQQAFTALRGAPTQPVSASVDRLIDSKDGRATGVDADNVYRVKAPTGGTWALLPGKEGICLVLEDREGISTCANTLDAKAGALRVLLIAPKGDDPLGGAAVQVGVLSDAVASASATLTSGVSLPIKVGGRGQYAVSSGDAARPTGLRLRGGNGQLLKQRSSWDVKGWTKTPAARAAAFGVFCNNQTMLCTFYGNEWRGPYNITSSAVSSWDGNWICGNAVNPDGTWAGTTYCANTTSVVSHPWNGSSRTVWAAPGVAGVPVYGFGSWLY